MQIDDFGEFVLGGDAVGDGADADEGGKVADTAVQFGEHGGGGGGVGGRVDEDGGGLPLQGGEGDVVGDGADLLGEETAVFHLHGYVVDAGDGVGGNGRYLFLLGGG